jgi:hypothetical protein
MQERLPHCHSSLPRFVIRNNFAFSRLFTVHTEHSCVFERLHCSNALLMPCRRWHFSTQNTVDTPHLRFASLLRETLHGLTVLLRAPSQDLEHCRISVRGNKQQTPRQLSGVAGMSDIGQGTPRRRSSSQNLTLNRRRGKKRSDQARAARERYLESRHSKDRLTCVPKSSDFPLRQERWLAGKKYARGFFQRWKNVGFIC